MLYKACWEESPPSRPASLPSSDSCNTTSGIWSVCYSTAMLFLEGRKKQGRPTGTSCSEQGSESNELLRLSSRWHWQSLFGLNRAGIRNNRAVISLSGCRRAAILHTQHRPLMCHCTDPPHSAPGLARSVTPSTKNHFPVTRPWFSSQRCSPLPRYHSYIIAS